MLWLQHHSPSKEKGKRTGEEQSEELFEDPFEDLFEIDNKEYHHDLVSTYDEELALVGSSLRSVACAAQLLFSLRCSRGLHFEEQNPGTLGCFEGKLLCPCIPFQSQFNSTFDRTLLTFFH
jgi:hypothetical protein